MSLPGVDCRLRLPHQAPCRLSSTLSRVLSRRFGSAPIDGVPQVEWGARAGRLPGVMALATERGWVRASALESIHWAAYEEPNPEVLPCGAFVLGEPCPMEWVWGLSRVFDFPAGLAFQSQSAWLDHLALRASRLKWVILPWPGASSSGSDR